MAIDDCPITDYQALDERKPSAISRQPRCSERWLRQQLRKWAVTDRFLEGLMEYIVGLIDRTDNMSLTHSS